MHLTTHHSSTGISPNLALYCKAPPALSGTIQLAYESSSYVPQARLAKLQDYVYAYA